MIDPTKAGAVRRRAWPAFSPCPLRKDGPKAAGNRDRAAKRVLPPKRRKRSHSSKRSRCGTCRMRRYRCFPRSRRRAAGLGPFARRAGSPAGAKTAPHRRSARVRCHTPKGRFSRHTSEDAAHTACNFGESLRRAAAARRRARCRLQRRQTVADSAVNVQKTQRTHFRVRRKGFGERRERPQMKRFRVARAQENRVIAPKHARGAKPPRKFPKCRQQDLPFGGQSRLDVGTVWRQRKLKHERVRAKRVEAPEHRHGVFLSRIRCRRRHRAKGKSSTRRADCAGLRTSTKPACRRL